MTRLTGTITDPGTLDTFTLDVNWDDVSSPNNVEQYTYPAGTASFELTHRYLDDNPTATASDNYTIGLTITDDDTGNSSATAAVTVNNVVPLLGDLVATTIDENGVTRLTGTITDPGTLDTFTLDVNWGDDLSPNNVEQYTYPAGTTLFELTHRYLEGNSTVTNTVAYVISVTVTDDDTSEGATDTAVVVFGKRIYGDANYDGRVTGQDLIEVVKNYGKVVPVTGDSSIAAPRPLFGDANRDGRVDGADIISVVTNYGQRVLLSGDPLFAINAGGLEIVDTVRWVADKPPSIYTNKQAAKSTAGVMVVPVDLSHPSVPTDTPEGLFHSYRLDRVSGSQMQWKFPVSEGEYEVRLYFAETHGHGSGGRVFDVYIEGNLVLNDYDIVLAAGGEDRAVVESFVVNSDSVLEIDFNHVVDTHMFVNAIAVLPILAPDTLLSSVGLLDFESVDSGDSVARQLSLTNAGLLGDPDITVNATTITGLGASQFNDNFDDLNGVALAPGQSVNIDVAYSPLSAGSDGDAVLAITHSGANRTLRIDLDILDASSNVPVLFSTSELLVSEE